MSDYSSEHEAVRPGAEFILRVTDSTSDSRTRINDVNQSITREGTKSREASVLEQMASAAMMTAAEV